MILGAGLAGLRTAQLLKTAGLSVTILEGRKEPGGRVRTIRAPFEQGLHAEAGAMRISSAHRRVLASVRNYGLTLLPFTPANGASLSVVGSHRIASTEDPRRAFANLDLHENERGLDPAALLDRYVTDIPAEFGDPAISPADRAGWAAIDRQTWPDWLKSRGASSAAVTLMTLGGDASDLSALYVLRQVALHRGARTYYKIAQGMDALPRAMASELRDSIRFGTPAMAIDRAQGGFRVTYLDGGALRTVSAGTVVVTLPFSVLRDMSIDPPLAPEKRRAIRDIGYFPGTRFLFECRSRFWHSEGLNGASRTDQPVELWDAAYEVSAPSGILGATAAGEAGRHALTMNEDAAIGYGLDLASVTFPSIRSQFERGVVHRWANSRWSRGAFAIFRPGQMTALTPHIAAPEDRLHFAGEHTSPWMGWMEGALESAERVANEILRAK
ncbi:MAG TPA: FAD-dependent oxidoreductase [Alphaproteobacteria bacterium]|nr:FAD-dependent oxidoreductase [Alphaproteobacteria bacterium]